MSDADLLMDAARRAQRYLAEVRTRAVAPAPEALARLGALGGPLEAKGMAAGDVLRLLDEVGSPASVASAGGRYFGLVVGGALPVTVAASFLVAAWDQNAAMRLSAPAVAAIEDVALGWLRDLLGLPATTGGAFVTGASMASFTALAAARHALLARAGWDVEAQGLFGAPALRVVMSEEAHVCVPKALALLGFGHGAAIRVPVDGQGRMRAQALPPLDARTIVCIQSGNVNTGAFDPAAEICRRARAAGAWVHVDGAFGLWAACAPARAHLAEGVALADSWAVDGHKWLNTPHDCGMALVRAPEHLWRAMASSAAYLQAGEAREPSHYGPELSRRARAVELWAALRFLGRDGVADLVERCCRHAARLAARLEAAGLRVLNEVVLNQVLVAAEDDMATDRLIAAVQRDGTCWCGGTLWHGRRAMRVSIASWATTEEDMDLAFHAIVAMARQTGALRRAAAAEG